VRSSVLAAAVAVVAWQAVAPPVDAIAPQPVASARLSPPSDLDAFMAKVLERRNETWRTLHDYILSERERFELTGPGDLRLYGQKREYTWFVRDGYLIRSPLRLNGVAPGDRERQDYENRWLTEEKARETRAAEKASKAAEKAKKAREAGASAPDDDEADAADESEKKASPDVAGDPASEGSELVLQGIEPRFISEAYFMQFKFDPGNYYLAGRETLDGRDVLRIEYYPKKLFADERKRETKNDAAGPPDTKETKSLSIGIDGSVRVDTKQEAPRPPTRAEQREREREVRKKDFEKDVEHRFNKVAIITLWVDPGEHQIVKYTFENTEFNFLPGRWLVRVGDVSASMTMGQYFKGVWLPRGIAMHASLMLANGAYDAHYARDFFDYRQGEVKARIRSYSPMEN
jgi:hypothetical protein